MLVIQPLLLLHLILVLLELLLLLLHSSLVVLGHLLCGIALPAPSAWHPYAALDHPGLHLLLPSANDLLSPVLEILACLRIAITAGVFSPAKVNLYLSHTLGTVTGLLVALLALRSCALEHRIQRPCHSGIEMIRQRWQRHKDESGANRDELGHGQPV